MMIPETFVTGDVSVLSVRFRAAILLPVFSCLAIAQTTQGLIEGRVTDLRTSQPVPNCRVVTTPRAGGSETARTTGTDGRYVLAPLSPGSYDIVVDCDQYQRQESHNVRLEVASLVLIDVRVRSLAEVWEDNYRRLMLLPDSSLLTLYGPDVDISHTSVAQPLRGSPGALETTVSQTIGGDALTDLPLSGRDAYTLLVLQPGVTSDSGISRSLDLSVNGQRASASEFLLDGIEYDNPLVTGPLSPIAPEALSEYRISSNSFSAEYGRAAGYVVNAITRSGTAGFHGVVYFYARNEKLVARDALVVGGDPSAPFRELQPGAVVTGPIYKRWRLLGSLSWENTWLYTRQPAQQFTVPTRSWIDSLNTSSLAFRWLSPFASSAPEAAGSTYTYSLAPPLRIDRQYVLPHVDWASPGGSQHLTARYAGSLVNRPDFDYSPYQGFSVDLSERTQSAALSWIAQPSARISNEVRFGFSLDTFSALRPHPEVPVLGIDSSPDLPQGVNLPSVASPVSFLNRTRSIELDDSVSYDGHKHIVRAGGGLISRQVSGVLATNDVPQFDFNTLADFANDAPVSVIIAVARVNPLTSPLPDFNRQYSMFDWYGFLQDSYRPAQRLTLSAGLRYDWFGTPEITGSTGDYLLHLPAAGDVPSRLAAATLLPASQGDRLYQMRHNGLAFRGGLSYALDGNSSTVLRASFGSFTDRPFDNLWQTIRNNDTSLVTASFNASPRNYSDLTSLLSSLPAQTVQTNFNDLTAFAPGFSTPRVMSWMSGIQHSLTERLLIEGDYLGSSSGSLVTTDRLNRSYSVAATLGNAAGRYVATLPDVIYRANQGRSAYSAMTLLTRYRGARFMSTLSYTLSRADDTQSDPLSGEFFDLGFGGGGPGPEATLIQQGNPSSNWGHADFDRRHNFVLSASWALPGIFEGFQFSVLAAARSGSPFTVFGVPAALSPLLDNPAQLVPGVPVWAGRYPAGAGVQLLNPAAFVAVANSVGNSGRNQFYGPGLVGADASLSRKFRLPHMPESVRMLIRMDFYNVFNHANLGNPDSNLSDPAFGIATRGPQPVPNAFGIFAPLGDSRRQAQAMLKVQF